MDYAGEAESYAGVGAFFVFDGTIDGTGSVARDESDNMLGQGIGLGAEDTLGEGDKDGSSDSSAMERPNFLPLVFFPFLPAFFPFLALAIPIPFFPFIFPLFLLAFFDALGQTLGTLVLFLLFFPEGLEGLSPFFFLLPLCFLLGGHDGAEDGTSLGSKEGVTEGVSLGLTEGTSLGTTDIQSLKTTLYTDSTILKINFRFWTLVKVTLI